jgi:dTDP-glucose 4,6-dehydratase
VEKGQNGEVYNVGGANEITNRDLTDRLLGLVGRTSALVKPVVDRPGHDRRYFLDSTKLRALGWTPQTPFDVGLHKTVEWYRGNEWWWRPIKEGDVSFRAYYETQYGG